MVVCERMGRTSSSAFPSAREEPGVERKINKSASRFCVEINLLEETYCQPGESSVKRREKFERTESHAPLYASSRRVVSRRPNPRDRTQSSTDRSGR